MKRFTETTKWADPWFQDLKPEAKLLWLYILDNCDLAGVWQINLRLASFTIGYEYSMDTVSILFGDRVKDLGNGKLWVSKFCRYQYGDLKPDCRPHAAVIERLKSIGLLEDAQRVSIGLANPTGKGKGTDKEQDKEKEQDNSSGFAEHPSWNEVWMHAQRIGLGEWKARDWFDEMEGCGWLDHCRRPIASWQAVMNRVRTKWVSDGCPSSPPTRRNHNEETRPNSPNI